MTYLKCNLLSVLSFVLVYVATHFLGDYFSSPFIMAGGYVLTMAMAGLFAPVRHTNKEISAEEAKKYKILALLMITLCYTLCASAFYIFGVYQTLIIFPTCLTVDIAMLISIVNNYYIFRRKTK